MLRGVWTEEGLRWDLVDSSDLTDSVRDTSDSILVTAGVWIEKR